jgi:hypothetical protein
MSYSLPTNYESIEGWCTKEKALKLMEIINIFPTENASTTLIVELGVFGGKSLLPMAIVAKRKFQTAASVIGIDAWSAPASLEGSNDEANDDWWSKINYDDIYKYTTDLMIKYNVSDIVELWRNKSENVVDQFKDASIDLLHQDSNHSEEISTMEVNLYSPKIKRGGFWVFDDANWSTTKKAQDLLVSKGFKEIYAEKDGCWKVYRKY